MRTSNRRTATRVRDGRVQKKNNWAADRGDYFARSQDDLRIDRRDPRQGFRHLLTVAQLRSFVALLPEWDAVAVGLDAIVLDEGQDCMGWHSRGVIAVCAWEQDLWWHDVDAAFEHDHRELLDLLEVQRLTDGQRRQFRWIEAQARAFQLLHILPHELGHHHDRITTRSKRVAARGEPYAESYAITVQHAVWPSYARQFGI